MSNNQKYYALIPTTNWEHLQIIDLLLGWSAPRLDFFTQIHDPKLITNPAFLDYPYQVLKYYLKIVNYVATRLKFKVSRDNNNELVQLLAHDFSCISLDVNQHLNFGNSLQSDCQVIQRFSQLKETWAHQLDTDAALINGILDYAGFGEWVPDHDSFMVIKKVVSDSDILSSQPPMHLSCIHVSPSGLIDHNQTDLAKVDHLAYEMLSYQKKWKDLLADTNNFAILRTNNSYPYNDDNNFLMYMCSIGEMYGLYYWAISMYTKFATALTVNVALAQSNQQNNLQFDKLASLYDIDQEALTNLSVKYTSEYCYHEIQLMVQIISLVKPYLDI